jgi:hypothetical protein
VFVGVLYEQRPLCNMRESTKQFACSFDLYVCDSLGHAATSQKVTGSIPDEVIGFFSSLNPSSRTMALGSTQPLTEMSTKNLPGG